MDFVTYASGPTTWLLAPIALSAAAATVASEREWRAGIYVFKPLTTLLILALAAAGPSLFPGYRPLIVLGLALSLVGDVLLMLPRDRFVPGLIAFLLAHLSYIAAFGFAVSGVTPLILLPLLLYGFGLMRVLWRHLGRLRVAVAVYAAVLLLMAMAAVQRGAFGFPGAWLAAAGALLFVISDSALAVDRFRGRFPLARAVVLATYYAAQTLIACSVYS